MKSLLSIALTFFCLSVVVTPADAHINGQSVFKINGSNTTVAEAKNGRSLDEQQDIAPGKYTINQPLHFAVEIAKYPTPKSIFEKTNFIWDFGDGTEKKVVKYGYKISHTYTKEGSYLVTVTADYNSAGFTLKPQMLQSVLMPITATASPTQQKQGKSSHVVFYLFVAVIIGGGIFYLYSLKRKKKQYTKKSK